MALARGGEVGTTELEAVLDLTKSGVSYHTRVLYDAGLVRMRKEGRNRFYRLRPERLHLIVQALETYAANGSVRPTDVTEPPGAADLALGSLLDGVAPTGRSHAGGGLASAPLQRRRRATG